MFWGTRIGGNGRRWAVIKSFTGLQRFFSAGFDAVATGRRRRLDQGRTACIARFAVSLRPPRSSPRSCSSSWKQAAADFLEPQFFAVARPNASGKEVAMTIIHRVARLAVVVVPTLFAAVEMAPRLLG